MCGCGPLTSLQTSATLSNQSNSCFCITCQNKPTSFSADSVPRNVHVFERHFTGNRFQNTIICAIVCFQELNLPIVSNSFLLSSFPPNVTLPANILYIHCKCSLPQLIVHVNHNVYTESPGQGARKMPIHMFIVYKHI